MVMICLVFVGTHQDDTPLDDTIGDESDDGEGNLGDSTSKSHSVVQEEGEIVKTKRMKKKQPEVLSESQLQGELNQLLAEQSVDTTSKIEQLRFQPVNKSRLFIPLCRLVSLQAVRPALKGDITDLQAHFVRKGYMEGFGAFYVSLEDDEGNSANLTPAIESTWSAHWKTRNAEFEKLLLADPVLKVFSKKMFHVWDGNHRLQAWRPIIDMHHANELKWHYTVDCIILTVKGNLVTTLTALHEINW